jgi:hypothetical protein
MSHGATVVDMTATARRAPDGADAQQQRVRVKDVEFLKRSSLTFTKLQRVARCDLPCEAPIRADGYQGMVAPDGARERPKGLWYRAHCRWRCNQNRMGTSRELL